MVRKESHRNVISHSKATILLNKLYDFAKIILEKVQILEKNLKMRVNDD